MTLGGPPAREPARRRPGRAETAFSWIGWVASTLVAAALGVAALVPISFSGAFPDRAEAAGDVVAWEALTLALCLVSPLLMGLGHWRRRHIWYWPVLCAAAALGTIVALRAV